MGLKLSMLGWGSDSKSTVDKLCPEVLACILGKAAQVNFQSLKELARVNKSFREATCRCATTLVLRQKGSSRTESNGADSRACAALSQEMKLRPNVSKLKVDWEGVEALPGSLWPALCEVRWTSLDVRLSRKKGTDNFFRRLQASELSLRTLKLGSENSILDTDIERIVHAFPKLESLTLRELCKVVKRSPALGGACETSKATDSLSSLHLALPVSDLADAAILLPNSLQALRNLRIECYIFVSPRTSSISVDSPLKRIQSLRIDAWDQSLCNPILQDVVQNCPSLQQLVLYGSPYSTLQRTFTLPSISLPDFRCRCPDLREIVISRGEVLPGYLILRKLARDYRRGWPSDLKLRTILLEVDKDYWISSAQPPSLKVRVRIFRCVVPLGSPELKWGDPETPKRFVGEARAVRSWCKTFCT